MDKFKQLAAQALEFSKQNKTVLLSGLLIFSATANIYFYNKLADLEANPQKLVQAETKKMLEKVGELVVLPDDEEPTIATVSDPEKLKDQPFFANAKKGFKVLIYANAGKSILYDPVENRIVEIATTNVGQSR